MGRLPFPALDLDFNASTCWVLNPRALDGDRHCGLGLGLRQLPHHPGPRLPPQPRQPAPQGAPVLRVSTETSDPTLWLHGPPCNVPMPGLSVPVHGGGTCDSGRRPCRGRTRRQALLALPRSPIPPRSWAPTRWGHECLGRHQAEGPRGQRRPSMFALGSQSRHCVMPSPEPWPRVPFQR